MVRRDSSRRSGASASDRDLVYGRNDFFMNLREPATFKTPLNYSKIYNMHTGQMQDHICGQGSSILSGVNSKKSKSLFTLASVGYCSTMLGTHTQYLMEKQIQRMNWASQLDKTKRPKGKKEHSHSSLSHTSVLCTYCMVH